MQKIAVAKIDDSTRLDNVLSLLRKSGLPFQDIKLNGNLFFSYEDENGNVIGAGGLELYGDHSLLRSVVVVKEYQGKKIGQMIVKDLLQHAREKSLRGVYLLTETAPEFFTKLGFKNISRENVPSTIKLSTEFASVCPVSAICMEFSLLD